MDPTPRSNPLGKLGGAEDRIVTCLNEAASSLRDTCVVLGSGKSHNDARNALSARIDTLIDEIWAITREVLE